MRSIYQIRKYISLAACAAFSACMLFGCTRADVASSSQGASAANGTAHQSTVTGLAADAALAGAGARQEEQQAAADQTQPAAVSAPDTQNVSGTTTTAQNVSGTTTAVSAPAPAAQAAPSASAPSASAQPQQDTAQQAAAQPAQTFEGDVEFEEEIFSGEYERSDGEENVSIAMAGDSQISFQFLGSGIGATAQVNGSTAVYYGDDGYSITFDVAGDTLAVTVGGEDADRSLMNGIYYRVLNGGDDAEEEDAPENGEDEYYHVTDEPDDAEEEEAGYDAEAQDALEAVQPDSSAQTGMLPETEDPEAE